MELNLKKIEFQNKDLDLNNLEIKVYCQTFYKVGAC